MLSQPKKLLKILKMKQNLFLSPLIPGKIDTYQYDEETKYFEMYQNSLFLFFNI